MNEDQQIATIIATAKTVPKKIGIAIDDHKEERFIRKLRAGLPESDFLIECKPFTKGAKFIFITRKQAHNPSSN